MPPRMQDSAPVPPETPPPERKSQAWLWVVVAFVVLLSAWGTLITIALKNRPEPVPLKSAPAEGESPLVPG